MHDVEMIELSEAQKLLTPKEEFGKKKPNDLDTKTKISAVARIVLAEMATWPDEITSLLGRDPRRESFVKGVSYIIGAYMHIARMTLKVKHRGLVEKLGALMAKQMGPAAQQLKEAKAAELKERQARIKEFLHNRDIEVAKLRRQIIMVRKVYDDAISEVEKELPSGRVGTLLQTQAEIKQAYEEQLVDLEAHRAEVSELINIIDESKEQWNDKRRVEKRRSIEVAKHQQGTV